MRRECGRVGGVDFAFEYGQTGWISREESNSKDPRSRADSHRPSVDRSISPLRSCHCLLMEFPGKSRNRLLLFCDSNQNTHSYGNILFGQIRVTRSWISEY